MENLVQDIWREKANKLIEKMSFDAYKKANILPSGQKRKKHVPYSIPFHAEQLVECLKDNDEERAKAIFHLLTIEGTEKD